MNATLAMDRLLRDGELGDALIAEVRGAASVRPLSAGGAADGPEKLLLSDAPGRPLAVVHWSRRLSPEFAREGAERALAAREALGDRVGRHVLVPFRIGRRDQCSYAVAPYARPLWGNRLRWSVQRRRLRRPMLQWVLEVARATVRPASAEQRERDFRGPLQVLLGDAALPQPIVERARLALDDLDGGRWQPCTVLAHYDLWAGNLLLPAPPSREPAFLVIDWAGMRLHGHAVYDLLRIAHSLGVPAAALREQLPAHAQVLGCATGQLPHHLLAALGRLRADLGLWPHRDFVVLATSMLDTFDAAWPASRR